MGCTESTLASVAVAVDSLEDFEQPYEGAAHPLNEGSRIAHLKGLGVLDTVRPPRHAGGGRARRRGRGARASPPSAARVTLTPPRPRACARAAGARAEL